MKLGRKPYVRREETLTYKSYRGSTLPTIPAVFGHQGLVPTGSWGMLANDQVGDCVIAGAEHSIILWNTEAGKRVRFTDDNALADYSAVSGYDPNVPGTDSGCEIVLALQYQQNTGMIDADGARHKIGAFLSIDNTNLHEILEATYLFGVTKIGINFPDSAMDQFNRGEPWTFVPGATNEGGHDVEVVGYDRTWLYVITWGVVQKMSPEFFKVYCEEAWAVLSMEAFNGQGVTLEGFNLAQLQADLAELNSMPNPAPDPVPPVPDHAYRVNVSFLSPMEVDGDSDACTISTMDSLLPVAKQAVSINIQRDGQVFTPNCMTDGNGQSVINIISRTEETVIVSAKWVAPDGKTYTGTATAVWIKPGPTPTPVPTPTPSNDYQVNISFMSATEEDGNADNAIISTTDGQIPVAMQVVTLVITRGGGIYTPPCTTDANGKATVYLVSRSEETVIVDATWLAPNGTTHTCTGTAKWVNPVPTPDPVPLATLVLYYGDADLQIAADLAQYYTCPILQVAYATKSLLDLASTVYQVGGSITPADRVILLAGQDRFGTMAAVISAMAKVR